MKIRRLFPILAGAVMTACIIIMNHTTVYASSDRDIFGINADYAAVLYDSSNGMLTSEANAIAQSGDGFIWLGGYSGLIRFDGSSFYRYDSSTGISSVFALYIDDDGRIWIGTNENGIVMLDRDIIKAYGRVDTINSNSVRSMVADGAGNIIIGTTRGLAYIDAATLEIRPLSDPRIDQDYINCLVRDSQGDVYGLTADGDLFMISNLAVTAWFAADDTEAEQINSVYADPNEPGILYLGTTESSVIKASVGIDQYTGLDSFDVSPVKNINSMIARGDSLWVTGTNGIGYLDGNNRFRRIEDAPMNYSITNVMTDMEGNLWFTSTRQGVMKIVPDRFMDISKLAGSGSKVVNSTCVNAGKLYLGTDSGLEIIDFKDYSGVQNELTELLKGVRIRCIRNDDTGRIWLCTHGDTGLTCYDPADGHITIYNEENGIDSNRIRDAIVLRDNTIAAATGNGLFLVSDEKVTQHYGQESGLSVTEILTVEEDPDGKLYLGSDGDGIYVIDDDHISKLGVDDGLTSEVILRIKWDEERNMMWLITSNSIEYMKDGVITAVTKFPYSNNYDIYFDDNGDAWVLSSDGIYIAPVDSLIEDSDIRYSFFNKERGLSYIPTGNSRDHIGEDGMLYIAGTTGVCAVNINAGDPVSNDIKLVIPAVDIDDREIVLREEDTVTIPAGSKRLAINAYALTYGLSNPTLCYWLEGFDLEPIITSGHEMDKIVYTNLDGGSYTFHFELLDDLTQEPVQSVSLNIDKERSIYDNFLFWLALIVLTVGITGLIMWKAFSRRQLALLKKQEEDRKLIDQIMHTFAKSIDLRDQQNQGHSFRVAYYTRLLAEELREKRGYTREDIDEFYHIALMHDIGKLSIPDRILNKPERLDDEEYSIMKTHAENGAHMLKNVTIVRDLSVGAGCHHERMDGKGYPNGLSGDEIPECARIIAVADTFDAMYSTRPYRKQLDISVVLDEMKRIRGTQLDAEVVDALFVLAQKGELNREKVDEVVRNLDVNKEHIEIVEEAEDSITDQDREDAEFLNNLGFQKGEENAEDTSGL